MTLLAANPKIVRVQTQYGPIPYVRNGRVCHKYVDFCVDYDNGFRMLIEVRASANLSDLPIEMELITNQVLKQYANRYRLWTELEISKPKIYRAEEMMRAKSLENKENTSAVSQRLQQMGGSATIFDLFASLQSEMTFAAGWTAVWALMGSGAVRHEHREPDAAVMTRLSRITITGANHA